MVQDLYRPGSGHHINNLGTLGTLYCREWLMLKLGYTHTVTQGSLLKCGHISVTPFSSSDRQICLSVTTDLFAYVRSPHLLPLPCYPGLPRDVAYQLAESDKSFDAKTVRLSVCVLFEFLVKISTLLPVFPVHSSPYEPAAINKHTDRNGGN